MLKNDLRLDERLASVAELVPEGTVLLDVGTDHGYLPTRLILDGKIKRAGASDVNPDPLSKAVRTAEKYGVSDRISFYLSDGLLDIPDPESYTAVSICGMGGELIARIISESGYIRRSGIPLVLQPVSSAEELSRYLADAGFRVDDERIAYAAGKLYRVILTAYDGVVRTLSPAEHILGRINIERGCDGENFPKLLKKTEAKYRQICIGKEIGGVDCAAESAILAELYSIAEKEGILHDDP